MPHDVFISYATSDKPVADAVCAGLEARGLSCWIAPRDILPGLDWGAAIIDAITECRAMVLVFSSNANASKQIKREVERAVAKGVTIIPLRVEDVPLGKTLEYFISTQHWMDAVSKPLEPHVERLAETVRALLARPSRATDSGIVSRPETRPRDAAAPQPAASSVPPQARAQIPPPPPASPTPPETYRSPPSALPGTAPPPRRFRPGALIAGAVVVLGLIAIFMASRGSAPQIVSVQFPLRIWANGQPAQGMVFFRTKKSDVVAARFDVISAANFHSFSFPIGAPGTKEGSVGFYLQTTVPQRVTLQATVIDAAGHPSPPIRFTFDSQAPPAAAPAPPPGAPRGKAPRRGFEIQAPNGYRFKVKG